MPDNGIKLKKGGIGAILGSPEMAALADEWARKVAAQIGPEAEVEGYTTDRQAASVKVPAHLQARDGALTKAAAAVGLTVSAKK